jgi:hypothetical protein
MIKIPQQYSSLKFLGQISWNEVFDNWRKLEAWQESWKRHWESRGFSSWDEWREGYAAPLNPAKLEWFLYQITSPIRDFPLFYGVPSRSWVDKAYGGETTKQLKDILDLPIVTKNPKVLGIKKDFPKKTMFTGIVYGEKIILVEGMHRSCVLAGWDPKAPFEGEVTIALALWEQKEIPIVGGNYKKK